MLINMCLSNASSFFYDSWSIFIFKLLLKNNMVQHLRHNSTKACNQLSQLCQKINYEHLMHYRLSSNHCTNIKCDQPHSALEKLIRFRHTTLESKLSRWTVFQLIIPSPYAFRNLPQLLPPPFFCKKNNNNKNKALS